jgi:AcrR family transcriptional regulator
MAPREPKRDVTRRLLLRRALALFQKKGVEATTMRDIAKAAGLSLGAAYYHFPSKDALVFAYYEETQTAMEAVQPTGSLRERLGRLFHHKLELVRPHRRMLGTIVHRLIDPSDPLSVFSEDSATVRARSIAVFERALAGEDLPRELAARGLWLVMLGLLLALVRDASAGARRTHRLADETLDMLVPLAPMLATPTGRAIGARIASTIKRHLAA